MRNTPKRNARVRAGARAISRLPPSGGLTVLREAVRCAATTGAKSPTAYVLTLLQDWHYAGVRTADEVGEYAYLRDVVEGRQPGDRDKAQQALAQMRRRHQRLPEDSEEGADG